MSTKGDLAVTLKVVLHDVDPLKITFTPSAPAAAYFVYKEDTTTKDAVVGNTPSEIPLARYLSSSSRKLTA